MSKWTHSSCDGCWTKRNPGRIPARMKQAELEDCCFCGNPHRSGIYVREDPNSPELKCKGGHDES